MAILSIVGRTLYAVLLLLLLLASWTVVCVGGRGWSIIVRQYWRSDEQWLLTVTIVYLLLKWLMTGDPSGDYSGIRQPEDPVVRAVFNIVFWLASANDVARRYWWLGPTEADYSQ